MTWDYGLLGPPGFAPEHQGERVGKLALDIGGLKFFALPMRTSSSVLRAGTCGTSPRERKARRVRPYSARNCVGRHSTLCCDTQRSWSPLRLAPPFSSCRIRSRLTFSAGDLVAPFAHR